MHENKSEIECCGQRFRLLPEKAIIWEERKTLILADTHFGKITHFRKSGMALPRQAEFENYERLSLLLLNHEIDRVLILGDLFHSRLNSEWDHFVLFLKRFHDYEFNLVMGNHDILDKKLYGLPNLTLRGELFSDGPFDFSHEPLENPANYNICGHVHPGVRMKGAGKQSLRLPCFHFTDNQAIIPAFGSFTGLYIIEPRAEDRIFVVAGNAILNVG